MSSSRPFSNGVPYVPTSTLDAAADAAGGQLRPDVQTARVNGTTITFTPSPAVVWLVGRITVQSTVIGAARVYVIPAGMAVTEDYFVAGTFSGDADEDDTNQPIVVPEGHVLTIVWDNAGAPARARIEYRELAS